MATGTDIRVAIRQHLEDLSAGRNTQKTVTRTAPGPITLTFQGQTTGPIADAATAKQLRQALEALAVLSPGDITVAGADPVYVITVAGIWQHDDNFTLTGTNASVAQTQDPVFPVAPLAGYTWMNGRVEGPIEGRLVGCVYPSPDSRREAPVVDYVTYNYAVRAFAEYHRSTERLEPFDPTILETLDEALIVALDRIQIEPGGGRSWYLRAPRSRTDLDVQGIEVEVVVNAENAFTSV